MAFGHLIRLVSSVLAIAKSAFKDLQRIGGQLLRSCDIIAKQVACIEMRQCQDSMSENEALRLLERDFLEWRTDLSLDYFPRQFSYMMFKLHCVRKSLSISTDDELLGQLIATHLKYNLKHTMGSHENSDDAKDIQNKLQIMCDWFDFFRDLQELDTIQQLYRRIHEIEGTMRSTGIAYAALGDRPYFVPGVGTPRRGWLSRCRCPECRQAVEDDSSTFL